MGSPLCSNGRSVDTVVLTCSMLNCSMWCALYSMHLDLDVAQNESCHFPSLEDLHLEYKMALKMSRSSNSRLTSRKGRKRVHDLFTLLALDLKFGILCLQWPCELHI